MLNFLRLLFRKYAVLLVNRTRSLNNEYAQHAHAFMLKEATAETARINYTSRRRFAYEIGILNDLLCRTTQLCLKWNKPKNGSQHCRFREQSVFDNALALVWTRGMPTHEQRLSYKALASEQHEFGPDIHRYNLVTLRDMLCARFYTISPRKPRNTSSSSAAASTGVQRRMFAQTCATARCIFCNGSRRGQ